MSQISLPLDWTGRDKDGTFLQSESNRFAVRHLDHWGIWPVRTSVLTGLETWFTLPGRPGTAPAPYKMALLTWITIFPLITAIVVIIGPLIEELPLVVRLGITTAIAVPLMTWIVMPRVTRLLRGCLDPTEEKTA